VAIACRWLESLKTPNFQGHAALGCADSAEKQGLATTKAVQIAGSAVFPGKFPNIVAWHESNQQELKWQFK
jgi:hypothetical protein